MVKAVDDLLRVMPPASSSTPVPLMVTPTPATFFIVPMAISLGFGVMFATVITLFLVPSLYLILYDFTTHREHVEDVSRIPTSTPTGTAA